MNWEQIVERILTYGKLLATEAYKLSLQQVWNVVRIDSFWAIILGILAIICFVMLRKFLRDVAKRNAETENSYYRIDPPDEAEFWIYSMGGLVSAVLTAILVTNIIMFSGNPGWYAARWMVENFIQQPK